MGLPSWVSLMLGLCLAALVAGQGANYARDSDELIDWMAQGASIARNWNEAILYAIRRDNTRPPIHARNLFHLSVAMYDAWAAYETKPKQFMHQERVTTKFDSAEARTAARNQTISFACYKLLRHRFVFANNKTAAYDEFDRKMMMLGYDKSYNDTEANNAASLGLRIAQTIIERTYNDGANEKNNYDGAPQYQPKNKPLWVERAGNPLTYLTDPNSWQPLTLGNFVDQNGVESSEYPSFVGPHWGFVTPFSLVESKHRSPDKGGVWLDPGDPPRVDIRKALRPPITDDESAYIMNFTRVAIFSSYLDPTDNVTMDISPGAMGNNSFGTNDGKGHSLNPKTGLPYAPQVVKRGDYTRILAEFWADGPHSETPPGHWNVLLNYVSYHPQSERKWNGQGEPLDPLEWDIKAYMALNGAMHDAAIACWGAKGYYDSSRPISAIRYMSERGQSTYQTGPIPSSVFWSAHGLPVIDGLVEPITAGSTCPTCKHAHLKPYVKQMAVKAWRGPPYINSSFTGYRGFAGVGWIRAAEWWPYQRPNFVTPPFAGYVSGHSTYSRCAADILTAITGDEYFPGGMGRFEAPKNAFLVFEQGPSEDVELQWATYSDAADECSLSRIYGGIHPSFDDIPGRIMGRKVAEIAWEKANSLWNYGWWEEPAYLAAFIIVVGIASIAFVAGVVVGIRMLYRNYKRKRDGWKLQFDKDIPLDSFNINRDSEESSQDDPAELERSAEHDPELE